MGQDLPQTVPTPGARAASGLQGREGVARGLRSRSPYLIPRPLEPSPGGAAPGDKPAPHQSLSEGPYLVSRSVQEQGLLTRGAGEVQRARC